MLDKSSPCTSTAALHERRAQDAFPSSLWRERYGQAGRQFNSRCGAVSREINAASFQQRRRGRSHSLTACALVQATYTSLFTCVILADVVGCTTLGREKCVQPVCSS